MHKNCPFCDIVTTNVNNRIISQTKLSFVIRDGFPISKGHTLVIPKRHISSFFEITPEEQIDLFSLLAKAKKHLENKYYPDAYNIGINDGIAAGQTVPHLHIHLIPRYKNDVTDPRGGIRWVKPENAAYWSDK